MEEKKLKFINLLKRRQQMSKTNEKKVKTVSTEDPQLMEVIKNFNETNDYKNKFMKKI